MKKQPRFNIKFSHEILLIFMTMVILTLGSLDLFAKEVNGAAYSEISGNKNTAYLVQDINILERPYNYLIGTTTFPIIEILGVLAALGAIGFALLHGFGRFLANKKIPIILEETGKEYIYSWITRTGHWLNAITMLGLLISGFLIHYYGPGNVSGRIHNVLGYLLVIQYALFLIYEILSGDIKQYIPQPWELKEGILKQGLFYAIGIFKREEHPYHMKKEARLNPLQKPAYFGIMFGLLPVVIITGFTLLRPDIMGFLIGWIGGLENMKFIFIIHLISAFGLLAFLLGHLYLATTGDKVKQHFEVMITGFNRIYKYRLKD